MLAQGNMIVCYCYLFFILSITYGTSNLPFNTFTKSSIKLFHLEKEKRWRRRRLQTKVGWKYRAPYFSVCLGRSWSFHSMYTARTDISLSIRQIEMERWNLCDNTVSAREHLMYIRLQKVLRRALKEIRRF